MSLVRGVQMHEFLMSGGVKVGNDQYGRVVYSEPITVDKYPECPWHEGKCPAWEEIIAGRGHWTRMEAEREALREALTESTTEEEFFELESRLTKLEEELSLRPRDAKALRERTPEQIAAEKAEYARKHAKAQTKFSEVADNAKRVAGVYAAAGPKTGGNPWDRKTNIVIDEATGEVFDWRPKPHLTDSRDDAYEAFGGEIPDAIEVDGDEGEEGDE